MEQIFSTSTLCQRISHRYAYVQTFCVTFCFYLLILPLCYFYRAIVILAAKCFKCMELHGILDTVSQVFAADGYADNDTTCSLICVLELHGKMTKGQLTKLVHENVVNASLNGASFSTKIKYPQLKYYPYSFLGYWFWKSESDFRTETHVKAISPNIFKSAVEIHQYLLNTRLPRNESPWDITLFRSATKDSTFIAVRLHHSLGDGKSLLKLIVHSLGCNTFSTAKTASVSSAVVKETNWLWRQVKFPFIAVQNKLSTKLLTKQTADHPWRVARYKPDISNLVVKMSKQFNLNDVKAASKRNGGICTSAFLLAAIAGAAKRFLNSRNPTGLCIPFAVAKPNHPQTLKNYASQVAIILPVNLPLRTDRLYQCHKRFVAAKNDHSGIKFAETMLRAEYWVPQFLRNQFSLLGSQVTTFTNLAGEQVEFSVGGLQCLDLTYSSGQLRSSIGVSFKVLSYCGKFRFSVISRECTIPKESCEYLVRLLEEELDLLLTSDLNVIQTTHLRNVHVDKANHLTHFITLNL